MTRPTASTTNVLRQRLDRLEAAVATPLGPGPQSPVSTLLIVLAAVHLGEAGPGRSVADGMAQALGYPGGRAMRTAMTADPASPARSDFSDRWRAACARLLALKGAAPDCDGPTFGAAIEALYSDMPKYYQHHFILVACGVVEVAS